MPSLDELITEQFRNWAFRGQGLELWDTPVSPEPAFAPFRGYDVPAEIPDDGRAPSIFSTLLRHLFSVRDPVSHKDPEATTMPRTSEREDLTELQVLFPADQKFSREIYHHFISSISISREHLAFELISHKQRITVQIVAHPADVPLVREQVSVFFPECILVDRKDFLRGAWDEIEGEYYAAVEFGLAKEFMLPLRDVKLDPHLGLIGALSEIDESEMCVFQVLFEAVRHPWAEHALRTVSDGSERPFFVNAPELLSGAEQKVSSPLYGTVVRVVVRSSTPSRVSEMVRNIAGALRILDDREGNHLIPVDNGEYTGETHIEDALLRVSRRSGMILNADELVSFVHFPSSDVSSSKLVRNDRRTRAAPCIVTEEGGTVLGSNIHAGIVTPVSLSTAQRLQHMFAIGGSGTGKSTFLFNLIKQDVESGNGVAVLDPHGDLIDRILGIIPPERIKDVVVVDPSDLEHPVGLNILHAHSELEKTLLASDLVSVFRRLSTSWGDQMDSVLRHGVMAFLESDIGGSLVDLRRFFLEPDFRKNFLKTVRDPEVVCYWEKNFPHLTGNKSIGPILTRLQTFLGHKSIRYMVAQRENRLDFANVLDSGKIFLAKLSRGAIGEENSSLLGTLIVSKFQQLAMARQAQAESSRRPYMLVIDECHHFVTPSMAEILTGARKYRLGLVLATQELRHLDREREVASAVLSNAYSRICFRVGDHDARALENGFSHFVAKDLMNLGTGEAICRIERSDYDFNLTTAGMVLPTDAEAEARRTEVIEASRRAYGRSRQDVEAALRLSSEKDEEPIDAKPVVRETVQRATTVIVPPVVTVPTKFPKPVIETPPLPGRGGKEHKYLQTFIKQWAEGMGWRTTIEAPVPEGPGSVDVLLSRENISVACEITVTTSLDHEIGNLKKCLAGEFSHVISVSPEAKRAAEMEEAAEEALNVSDLQRVRFYTPQQLFSFVQELTTKHAATEKTVKGYRVKVSYKPIDQSERDTKIENVAGVIAKSLTRMRKKKTEK